MSIVNNKNLLQVAIIFGLCFLLYIKSVNFDFTLDDAIVLSDNDFTQQGIKGLNGIFSYDTFYGFFGEAGKDKLVKGGRYRPFTLAMFALEFELSENNPFLYHLINIILYAFSALLIFLLGKSLFFEKFKNSDLLALICTLIFIAHPIHTEVVANIKGRDEIMALLPSLMVLYLVAKKEIAKLKIRDYFTISLLFFIGLLSKENAITFLLIIPLTLYFFRRNIHLITKVSLTLVVTTIIFLILRTAVIGWDFGASPSLEFMNNPFLKVENGQYVYASGSEKLLTISLSLWKYIQLLFVPFPLTHDYYPNHIELQSSISIFSVFGLLVYLSLLVFAIVGFFKRHFYAYIFAYYLIAISIVSNIAFPIGTHMSERFLFLPSLAFCLAIPYYSAMVFKNDRIYKIFFAAIILVFSILSFMRIGVWKDNYTLFTTDVKTSAQSAKVNNAAAGVILDNLDRFENPDEKKKMISQAIGYAKKAIEIHPNYINAYLLKGNGHFYLNEFENALQAYQSCLAIDPSYKEANNNIFLTYRNAGRYYGEKENDLTKALQYLNQAYRLKPEDFETNRLLGTCYGILGRHKEAVKYFEKCVAQQPQNTGLLTNLAMAYEYLGDLNNANKIKTQIMSLKSQGN